MRKINCDAVTELVAELCIKSNIYISEDIQNALRLAASKEASPRGCAVLGDILENIKIANEKKIPACQDTGMTVIFVEIGQGVAITGGNFENAINEGVAKGYKEGYLRASVVKDPFIRINTEDNTPPVIHYDIVPGDEMKISVAPKGFGSENMSAVRMLKPSDGKEKVFDFIVETVSEAGAKPCPPIIVGAGIGGTVEKAAIMAKKSLLREVGKNNSLKHISEMEREILKRVNNLGIGPGGLGGNTTALAVHIETYPTHIAGMPVAVNIGCHATRHASGKL